MIKMSSLGKTWPGVALLATMVILSGPAQAQDHEGEGHGQNRDWPMFGRNLANTASTTSEDDSLSARQVGKLKTKWVFTTGGDIAARASVVDGVVYFPDYGGNLWALTSESGHVVWSHKLSDYGLAAGTVSRTAPTVVDGVLYIGTQWVATGPTGWLLAINAATGRLIWKIQPDTSNSSPVITASPTVAEGVVYVGMTSNEEYDAANPFYPCCSARGNVVAVKADTGQVLWQTFTVPVGYTGGAVWGSNPVVDVTRGLLYVSTGDNYSIPKDSAESSTPGQTYKQCITAGGNAASCNSKKNYVDAVVALEIHNHGAIRWGTPLVTWHQPLQGVTDGSDNWNVACFTTHTNCPPNQGPDYDFGSGANEITYQTERGPKTIIGAGQKSGIYYALDPDNGHLLWQTPVGPGSTLGGMEWGSASDGKRIYVAIGNFFGIPYAAGSAGSWAALDPATGRILWQVADPNGSVDLGALTVANGVVYAPSMGSFSPFVPDNVIATTPTMFALDASNGKTLWSFAAGSSVIAGATVVGENVFWGSGYGKYGAGVPGFTGNNKFFAFHK